MGEGYTGSKNTTVDGNDCIEWSSTGADFAKYANSRSFRLEYETNGLNHSYCRNKELYAQPYCYVNLDDFEPCAIPACRKFPLF